jgi:hypothetical protein
VYAFEKYNWSIEQYTIGETFHYFIYVMTKGKKLDPKDKEFYCRRQQAIDSNNNQKTNLKKIQMVDDLNENYLMQIETE